VDSQGRPVSRHNILLIQNDAADAKTVCDALEDSADSSFKVEWVKACGEGLQQLAQERLKGKCFAAILLDLFLPDSRGIETFERLSNAAPQLPILILSGANDEEVAKWAVQLGAQDYLLKKRVDNHILPMALHSMIDRAENAEALFNERERAQVTLNSIGDAVMSIDVWGQVTYLNAVAETLTGWTLADAVGHCLGDVFQIIDGSNREPLQSPMQAAVRENKSAKLPPNCVLIRRDGHEYAIEDSTAPIHDSRGKITGAVMVFHDVSAARAQTARLAYLAEHDGLTDLPNRALLNDRLTQAIALAHRHKQKLGLLFLDLDRFKHINDSLGHSVGDRLLQSVARRLSACVRSSDTISRQGGDEFVILLSEMTHAQDAAIVADKVLRALRSPHLIDRHQLYVTGTIGIVTFPDDGTESETLMKNADIAMYHAKAAGRDNFEFFKPDMNTRAVARHFLEEDLRHAVEQQQFVLLYQPKIDLHTGSIIGVEALIRWRHAQRGLVSPAEFIPVAEECGFIVPIGRWVIRAACQQARKWQKAGLPSVRIAVNVSAVELRARDFASNVRDTLAETGLDPRYLELELTETFLMQDSNLTAAVLRDLKDAGVQLALDDFGTGYSSLSYVKRFPIDTLKIDRSFVRDLATDADDASIVSAVISMGKSLHMRVVAEGIETPEQLQYLQTHGCPFGQGYYFSRPVVAGEFVELLSVSARGVTKSDSAISASARRDKRPIL
jgi:diguanylate cyclase (GGDEF)-like protein/PAS domain S-box-containing protein